MSGAITRQDAINQGAQRGAGLTSNAMYRTGTTALAGQVMGPMSGGELVVTSAGAGIGHALGDALLPGANTQSVTGQLLREGATVGLSVACAYGVSQVSGSKRPIASIAATVLIGEFLAKSAGVVGAVAGGALGGLSHYLVQSPETML